MNRLRRPAASSTTPRTTEHPIGIRGSQNDPAREPANALTAKREPRTWFQRLVHAEGAEEGSIRDPEALSNTLRDGAAELVPFLVMPRDVSAGQTPTPGLVAPEAANGCGPASKPGLNRIGNALYGRFKPACDIHDTGTEQEPGYMNGTKAAADQAFLTNMHEICVEDLWPARAGSVVACHAQAATLWGLVSALGDGAYQSGQRAAGAAGIAPLQEPLP